MSRTRTTPQTPVSAAHRRGSPVAVITCPVAPWYERYRARIFCRPVAWRAILIAFSFASAPPLVKKKTSMSPGASSASLAPSRARGSCAMNGLAYASCSACSLDRPHHALVPVADVHAHQLRVEVQVARAVGRVEVDALRPLDRDRIDRVLGRPFVERVLARESDDLLARSFRRTARRSAVRVSWPSAEFRGPSTSD